MILQNEPEVVSKLMYICVVYPRERKGYGSFITAKSTMISLKTRDVNLENGRDFDFKVHFENIPLKKVQEREFF